MTLEQIAANDYFKDFRAKLWFLYDAIGETYGTKVSYTWILYRLKGGNIGTLCKQAVDTMGSSQAKFILQGRNENTGLWMPTEKMIKLGKSSESLLP